MGKLSAAILAGGQAKRMGQSKADLPWQDKTLLGQIIDRLDPIAEEIIVAGYHGSDLLTDRVRVVQDIIPNKHALGGIYTALMTIENEYCFICSCDMPFLNPALLTFLYQEASAYELVIPQVDSALQPLHAVYARSTRHKVERALKESVTAPKELRQYLKTKVIEEAVISKFDPALRSFENLNTPEQYQAALQTIND